MRRIVKSIEKVREVNNGDHRGVKTRLLYAGTSLFSLLFIIMFFGPLDIYLSNSGEFSVDLFHMFISLGGVFIISFFIFLIPILFLKGYFFDNVVAIISILSVEFYVQSVFLNNIGALTGGLPKWHLMSTDAIINIMIWIVMLMGLKLLFLYLMILKCP